MNWIPSPSLLEVRLISPDSKFQPCLSGMVSSHPKTTDVALPTLNLNYKMWFRGWPWITKTLLSPKNPKALPVTSQEPGQRPDLSLGKLIFNYPDVFIILSGCMFILKWHCFCEMWLTGIKKFKDGERSSPDLKGQWKNI